MSADQSAVGAKAAALTNKEKRLARKAEKQAKRKADPEVDGETIGNSEQALAGASGEDAGAKGNDADLKANDDNLEEEVEAVSHKEMRKRRRLEKQAARSGQDTGAQLGPAVHPSRAAAVASANATTSSFTRSRHSIWIGNLSFRTSPERLQEWFEEKGINGISRVNMPKGAKKMEHNKGFAYVDVPSSDAVQSCIDLSESHLDGRRLLIKSGSDYSGRPEIDQRAVALASSTNAAITSAATSSANPTTEALEAAHKGKTGLTKTAQKILRAQKHPPGPTLFIGNLSFNSTEDGVREMIERTAAARDEWSSQKEKKKKKTVSPKKASAKKESRAEDSDSSDDGNDSSEGEEEEEEDDDDDERGKRSSSEKSGNTSEEGGGKGGGGGGGGGGEESDTEEIKKRKGNRKGRRWATRSRNP